MSGQPIAIGGSMDNKVTVSLHQTDDGEIVCTRSWQEGEGDKSKYKNEEFVMNDEDISPAIKKLFEKGTYLEAKKNVFEKASEDMDKNGFKKELKGEAEKGGE